MDLLTWMKEQGLPPNSVALKDRDGALDGEAPIHYVVASQKLKAGDLALRVPNELVVTLEKVLGDETIAELLTTNKLSELACLALYLMYEKKRGAESFWRPFIAELDRQRGRGQQAVESPLLWTREEIDEYFQGSPMRAVVLGRLEGIKREYEELDTVWFMAGSLFQQYPFDIPSEAFSFEIFKQAFTAVQACVVHLQGVSLARRFALVPLGPPLLSYASNSRAMLQAVDGAVELRVDRDVEEGEPIIAWCGPQPNSRMLLNYGVVDEDNPYDRLQVEAALNTEDPLYQSKRAIVQRNDRLSKQSFQLYKGKEKDAVLDMLPYLRLAHASNPDDVSSVSFAQGPVCTVSACNEAAVLRQLETFFTNRLAAYPTTKEEDKAIINNPQENPRRRVSAKLVRIEKEILENALAEVQEIIEVLPQGLDVSPCTGDYEPILK